MTMSEQVSSLFKHLFIILGNTRVNNYSLSMRKSINDFLFLWIIKLFKQFYLDTIGNWTPNDTNVVDLTNIGTYLKLKTYTIK